MAPVADADPVAGGDLEKFRLYGTRARFYVIEALVPGAHDRPLRAVRAQRQRGPRLVPSAGGQEPPPAHRRGQPVHRGPRLRHQGLRNRRLHQVPGVILPAFSHQAPPNRLHLRHAIYCIDESQMITIPHLSVQTDVATSKNELRYRKLLAIVDLPKDFFYSYTYPIMQSLQQNVTSAGMKEMPYENLFVWNTFLTEPIRSRCRNTLWTVVLVHGHFKQARLSIFGREINVVFISRRPRHFAGTRYLKRGVNDHGKVANDVETKPLVLRKLGKLELKPNKSYKQGNKEKNK